VVHPYQAKAHIDLMKQDYTHMDWGTYTSDWRDLDALPYLFAVADLARMELCLKAALLEQEVRHDIP
jgi:peptidoglycan/xylan/chitin deacetylase (PgdA/CDA1 family)